MLMFFLIQIHILITLESWVKEMKHGIITKVVQDLGIHILSEIQSLVARAQAILEDCRLISSSSDKKCWRLQNSLDHSLNTDT